MMQNMPLGNNYIQNEIFVIVRILNIILERIMKFVIKAKTAAE